MCLIYKRVYMTMTTVWNTTTRMARTLLTETSQSVQSGCRSMMKKVTNSEKSDHVSTSQVGENLPRKQ